MSHKEEEDKQNLDLNLKYKNTSKFEQQEPL